MKKLLFVLMIAGTTVACNNAADAEQRLKDSLDSVENAKKDMIDSVASEAKDSVEQSIDAKEEMVDSMHLDSASH